MACHVYVFPQLSDICIMDLRAYFFSNTWLKYMQGIAQSVGNWFFDRAGIQAVGCAYPCDKTCHNLVFH